MQVSIYLLLRSRSAHQIKIDKAINLQVNCMASAGGGYREIELRVVARLKCIGYRKWSSECRM